jgi:hypothetical protein
MTQSSFSQALIWCCGSCGFVLEGGQPHMECPMCDSYREVFIDIPQQIESELRAEFGEEINAAPARAKRRAIVAEQGGMTPEVAVEWVKQFKKDGRYQRDVY